MSGMFFSAADSVMVRKTITTAVGSPTPRTASVMDSGFVEGFAGGGFGPGEVHPCSQQEQEHQQHISLQRAQQAYYAQQAFRQQQEETEEAMAAQRMKMRRNPEAPKRPMSPYVSFVKATWAAKNAELGPDAAAKDVMKALGQTWNAMHEAEKDAWKQQSEADKERYAEEMKEFSGPVTVPMDSKRKVSSKRRVARDPGAPKRGASAFLMFANDKRQELRDQYPDRHNVDISKMLGALWKSADDETKRPYLEREARARYQYDREVAAYRREQQERLMGHAPVGYNVPHHLPQHHGGVPDAHYPPTVWLVGTGVRVASPPPPGGAGVHVHGCRHMNDHLPVGGHPAALPPPRPAAHASHWRPAPSPRYVAPYQHTTAGMYAAPPPDDPVFYVQQQRAEPRPSRNGHS